MKWNDNKFKINTETKILKWSLSLINDDRKNFIINFLDINE